VLEKGGKWAGQGWVSQCKIMSCEGERRSNCLEIVRSFLGGVGR
jgi:hypothetical protein